LATTGPKSLPKESKPSAEKDSESPATILPAAEV